jgi:hypothetical protein
LVDLLEHVQAAVEHAWLRPHEQFGADDPSAMFRPTHQSGKVVETHIFCGRSDPWAIPWLCEPPNVYSLEADDMLFSFAR